MRALMLLVLIGCGRWSVGDTERELAVAAGIAADWAQTEHALDLGMIENNPAIGRAGERAVIYFPAVMAAHALLAMLLPERPRAIFQWASMPIIVGNLARNQWVIDGYEQVLRDKTARFAGNN